MPENSNTPYILDAADGVKGHYVVARDVKIRSSSFREVWLPNQYAWGWGTGVTWTKDFAEKVRDALIAGREPPTAMTSDIMSRG